MRFILGGHGTQLLKLCSISEVLSIRRYSLAKYYWKRRTMNSENIPAGYFFVSCDEESVKFTFLYKNLKDKMVKINLDRKLADPWVATVSRMAIKMTASDYGKFRKRKFKNKCDDEDEMSVKINPECRMKILSSGEVVDCENKSNEQVLTTIPQIKFKVKDVLYEPLLNRPQVESFKLPSEIYVGVPVMPSLDLINCEDGSEVIHWFISEDMGAEAMKLNSMDLSLHDTQERQFSVQGWFLRHTGPVYEPCAADINRRICVVCDLGKNSISSCQASQKVIKPQVFSDYLFISRQENCQRLTEKSMFRFASYNVLANLYLNLKLNQNNCWFKYCPKEYQDTVYRYGLLLKELPGYNCDVMCLQEVDYRLYMRYLRSYMSLHGFESNLCLKGFCVNEGLVTLYRTDKFKFVEEHKLFLVDELNLDSNSDILKLVQQTEETLEFIKTCPTIFHVTVLLGPDDVPVLIGNTHLPSNRYTPHIRLIHVALCLKAIDRLCHTLKGNVNVIFCGDLNSVPDSGVVDLLKTGSVGVDHPEWVWATNPIKQLEIDLAMDPAKHKRPTPGPIKFKGIHLKTERAYTCASGFPEFTNYTDTFHECIDYIWISNETLSCTNTVPVPEDSQVSKFIGLPSKAAPSDHLPLICDLKFKN